MRGLLLACLAVATSLLFKGQPRAVELSAAAMPSLLELHTMAGVHKLPDQDIDDQSVIVQTTAKQ